LTDRIAEYALLALQLVRISGFHPIITTASKHNEDYCLRAGATHVIDYHDIPYSSLGDAVTNITQKPIDVVFDAVSTNDSQHAGWRILAPHGRMIVTLPAVVSNVDGPTGNENGKQIFFTHANINMPAKQEFGTNLYSALNQWLQSGTIKV
jgi:NADPH:quinone reductase-like Zn-dependent oxidoreductase